MQRKQRDRCFAVELLALTLLALGGAERLPAEGYIAYDSAVQFGEAGVADVVQELEADELLGALYLAGRVSQDAFAARYDAEGNRVWLRTIGESGGRQEARGLALDPEGNVVVGGCTNSALPGQTSLGGLDGWIRLYDPDGNELWTRQFGTDGSDEILDLAVVSDGIVAGGHTDGSLPGFTNFGGRDAAVWKYDFQGNQLWVLQFGTETLDEVTGVDESGDALYVGGNTNEVLAAGPAQPAETPEGFGQDWFVRRLEPDGTEVWTVQFISEEYEETYALEVDDNVVIGGFAGLFATTCLVRSLDSSGNTIWTDRFESEPDGCVIYGIEADGAHAVVGGGIDGGTLPDQVGAGGEDAFVRRYDGSGNEIWTSQFGTSEFDSVDDAVVVMGSRVFVGGNTSGDFTGGGSDFASDAFFARFPEDADGDGLYDAIDLLPDAFSSDFSDGTSSGVVVEAGDQRLHVLNAAPPGAGVHALADSDGGPIEAVIEACDGGTTLTLAAGDGATVTCGSVLVESTNGSPQVELRAADGTVAVAELPAPNGLGFSPDHAGFIVPGGNPDPVSVTIDGELLVLEPGDQALLFDFALLLEPDECIDGGSPDPLPVALLTSDTVDATRILPSSVVLEGTGAIQCRGGGCQQAFGDLDGDGDIDQMVEVENALGLPPGDHTLVLEAGIDGGPGVWGSLEACVQ